MTQYKAFRWIVGRWHTLAVAVVLTGLSSLSLAAAPDTDALRAKFPDYAAALSALGEEQTSQAIAALTKLAKSDDPHLAADAGYFLGRALLIEERFEEALPVLSKITGQQTDQTTHAGEALYLQGTCEARLLKRKEAIAAWERFLKDHADAPERMRVDAARQVAELKQIKDGSIGDVQKRMDYARRRLALSDAGKGTRDRQEEIVAMLTKLIGEKETEQSEQESEQEGEGEEGEQPSDGSKPGSKSGSKPGSQPGSGSGGNTPGGSHKASGDDVAGRAHQSTDRGQFGDIKERQRMERIYGAMKDRYPAQYRKLVEQYSKSLQEERE